MHPQGIGMNTIAAIAGVLSGAFGISAQAGREITVRRILYWSKEASASYSACWQENSLIPFERYHYRLPDEKSYVVHLHFHVGVLGDGIHIG